MTIQCDGNQAAAARLLGFHRDRLVGIMGRRPDLRDLSTQLRNASRTTA